MEWMNNYLLVVLLLCTISLLLYSVLFANILRNLVVLQRNKARPKVQYEFHIVCLVAVFFRLSYLSSLGYGRLTHGTKLSEECETAKYGSSSFAAALVLIAYARLALFWVLAVHSLKYHVNIDRILLLALRIFSVLFICVVCVVIVIAANNDDVSGVDDKTSLYLFPPPYVIVAITLVVYRFMFVQLLKDRAVMVTLTFTRLVEKKRLADMMTVCAVAFVTREIFLLILNLMSDAREVTRTEDDVLVLILYIICEWTPLFLLFRLFDDGRQLMGRRYQSEVRHPFLREELVTPGPKIESP